jgi:proline iminopeptidase
MAFARIVTHYWRHGSWLEEGIVLRNAGRLAGIPGVIVQGSLDLGNLLGTPWDLVHAWPGSDLVLVAQAGHGASHPGMTDALIAATDRFASQRKAEGRDRADVGDNLWGTTRSGLGAGR